MQMSDPLLDEALRVFPAYQDLVARVMPGGTNPLTTDPADVAAAIDDLPQDAVQRLAHLMIANAYANNLFQGAALIGRLYHMAERGERPRFLGEMGIAP